MSPWNGGVTNDHRKLFECHTQPLDFATTQSRSANGVGTEQSDALSLSKGRSANLKVGEGLTSQLTPNNLELEKELELEHLKCLERLEKLRGQLELHYKDWYIAIDPDSGVYMIEPDLMKFYWKINTYFPQTLDLGLYRLNSSKYIGRI